MGREGASDEAGPGAVASDGAPHRPGPLRPAAGERERRAVAAATEVAGVLGLDPLGAGVWRAGSAVLVGLPAAGALARVDAPERAGDARRQVAVAARLAADGVPAVEPAGVGAQPVATGAGPVTVWRWVPPVGPPVTPAALGRAARRLHDRTRAGGPGAVPAHAPLAVVAAELDRAASAGVLAPDDRDRLRVVADDLASRWPRPGDDPLGAAVVHGDLHRANAVPGAGGPVLADLELAGWGPASADVAPQVVAVRRYGADPGDLEAFLAAYGADPRGEPGFEVLVEAYELWVTAWAVANRQASPRAEVEARRRLDRWRHGSSPPWSLR